MVEITEKTKKQLEQLSKTFDLANDSLGQLIVVEPESTNLPEINNIDDEVCQEVFTLQALKHDFILVRQNLIKLINAGQNIISTMSIMDVSDLNGKQIEALSILQNSIGSNLKLLISTYKDICQIEKIKKDAGSSIDTGDGKIIQHVEKQIVFTGDTNQLLKLMNEKRDSCC